MPPRPSQPSHGPHGGNQSAATPPIPSTRCEGLSRRATQRRQNNRKRLGVNTLGDMNARAKPSQSQSSVGAMPIQARLRDRPSGLAPFNDLDNRAAARVVRIVNDGHVGGLITRSMSMS